jgi:hypothetical protein
MLPLKSVNVRIAFTSTCCCGHYIPGTELRFYLVTCTHLHDIEIPSLGRRMWPCCQVFISVSNIKQAVTGVQQSSYSSMSGSFSGALVAYETCSWNCTLQMPRLIAFTVDTREYKIVLVVQ